MADRTDTLVLRPTSQQKQLLFRHAGARRFAYNACVANVTRLLVSDGTQPRPKLPWSPFDNINYFNAFKRSAEAGVAEDGTIGLAWRREVYQQVFEEGAKDFGRAMKRWGDYCKARKEAKRRGQRMPRKVGVPRFSTKRSEKATFRLRNNPKHSALVLGEEGLRVPHLGLFAIRGSTARVRRRLRVRKEASKTAYITQVTFRYSRVKQHWEASLAIHWSVAAAKPQGPQKALGCDVGIHSLVTVADEDGGQVAHHLQPKVVARGLTRTKRAQRALSLKRLASQRTQQRKGAAHRDISNSEKRAHRRLMQRHARVKNIRRAHMHRLTHQLVQTHGRIGIEGLHIAGMLKNHSLAGAIARQAWGEFLWQVTYKAAWRGGVVVVAPRFFPSSKLCSECWSVDPDLTLKDRTYVCKTCSWTCDRDVNSAINLAWLTQQSRLVHEKYSVVARKKSRSWPRQSASKKRLGLLPHNVFHERCGVAKVSAGCRKGHDRKP